MDDVFKAYLESPDPADPALQFDVAVYPPALPGMAAVPTTAAAAMAKIWDDMRWHWEFIHQKDPPVNGDQFRPHCHTWLANYAAFGWKQNPALHYATNHTLEDAVNYNRGLWWFLEEGPEAGHRHAHMWGRNSTKGRYREGESNAWEIMIRHQLAAFSMAAAGVASRFPAILTPPSFRT
jgi:hypothetical protein